MSSSIRIPATKRRRTQQTESYLHLNMPSERKRMRLLSNDPEEENRLPRRSARLARSNDVAATPMLLKSLKYGRNTPVKSDLLSTDASADEFDLDTSPGPSHRPFGRLKGAHGAVNNCMVFISQEDQDICYEQTARSILKNQRKKLGILPTSVEAVLQEISQRRSIRAVPPKEIYVSNVTLNDLPVDCLASIVSRLPLFHIFRCESVSRSWNLAAWDAWNSVRHANFWDVISPIWNSKYDKEQHFEPQGILQAFVERSGKNLLSLNFEQCPNFRLSRYSMELVANRCSNLISLNMNGCLIGANTFPAFEHMKKLEKLSLRKAFDLSYDQRMQVHGALENWLWKLPRLRHLEIDQCKCQSAYGNGGKWLTKLRLESLSLIDTLVNVKHMDAFLDNNKNRLKRLALSEYTVDNMLMSGNHSRERFKKLMKRMPLLLKNSLESLALIDFSLTHTMLDQNHSVKTFMDQLGHFTRLRELDLRRNRTVTEEQLRSICNGQAPLESLIICGCTQMTMKMLKMLAKLDNLKKLDVSKVRNFTEEILELIAANGTLEEFICHHNAKLPPRAIETLIANCPNIRLIDVRWCKDITADVVKQHEHCSDQVKILAGNM